MNELNKKEEQIKDILGGLEIDIDTNDIWANIESDLPQPEKKKRYGFILFFGVLALAFSTLGYSYFSNKNKNEGTIVKSIANNEIGSQTSIANQEKKTDISLNENTNNNVTRSTSVNQNNSEQLLEVKRTIATVEAKTQSNNKVVNNQITHTTKPSIANTPYTSNTINRATTLTSKDANKENTTSLLDNNIETNNNAVRNMLLTTSTPTLSSRLLDIANRQRVESSPKTIRPLHAQGRQLILQLKIGANQNRSTISDINSIGEFDASEFDFERDRLGVSGSFAIGVENKGWRFLAGIAYHHHVSTYQRDDVVIYKNPTTGIEYYRIDDLGQTTAQNGTTTITRVVDTDINFHRQHRAIDFQATIGKRLWSYRGLSLSADAGLGINTVTHSNGYYLEDDAFGFRKIENDDHPYKINTHWNAIASIELGYDFGKTRIGLSPFIRYNPNSITEQTHLYQLKNSQVGMQLSLTYSPTRE